MKSSSKLAKNTAIYAIGNFGTKILSYVMVLVYSYYITPEELGYYDVVLTTISMIQPLVIFQLNDGVFRFLIESKKEQNKAIIGNNKAHDKRPEIRELAQEQLDMRFHPERLASNDTDEFEDLLLDEDEW